MECSECTKDKNSGKIGLLGQPFICNDCIKSTDEQVTIEQRRLQASNICVDIYTDFSYEEILKMPESVERAWFIGSETLKLIRKG